MKSSTAYFFVPFFVAMLASLALTPVARRMAVAVGAIDRPGKRKVHREPMPRLGGLAVLGSIVLTLFLSGLIWPDHPLQTITESLAIGVGLGLVPLLIVSFWDDVWSLPAWPKFVAHAAGAAVAVSFGVCLSPTVHLFDQPVYLGAFAIPLSILWIMGVTNAFNIVDGLDGLSAGLALVSACSLAVIFSITNQPDMASASLVVAGALMGFLPYNLYPARIFLGDTGATAIGFCLGCFALRGGATLSSGFAVVMPLFFLGLPIADTIVSMARRMILHHERPDSAHIYEADQNHFHHRLLARGASHRKAVFTLYGVGLFFAAAALLSILLKAFEAGLLLVGLVIAGFVGIARLGYEEFGLIRRGIVLRFHYAPALRRSFFAVFVDVLMIVVAVHIAILLKLDNWATPAFINGAIRMVAVVTPVTLVTLWSFGLYRGTWRLAGSDALIRLGLAILTSTVIAFLAYQLVFDGTGLFSVFVIYALAETTMANVSRMLYRVLISEQDAVALKRTPVLVYGAGTAEGRLLPYVLADDAFGMRTAGFIDDDPNLAGQRLDGFLVWGGLPALEFAVLRSSARTLIVPNAGIAPDRLEAARAECDRLGVELVKMTVTFDSIAAISSRRNARLA